MSRVDSIQHNQKDSLVAMVDIHAAAYQEETRGALDLVLVLDVSGSMSGQRLTDLQETAVFVAENLESNDRLAIVAYASDANVVLPLTNLDAQGKKKVSQTILALSAGGSTALCDGLVTALEVLHNRDASKNPVASVMLFTDGQATDGYTTAKDIIKATTDPAFAKAGRGVSRFGTYAQLPSNHAQSPQSPPKRRSIKSFFSKKRSAPKPAPASPTSPASPASPSTTASVSFRPLPGTINTFGFGEGHKGELLEAIAEHGRGLYYYMENTDLISDVFGDCLGGLISVVAQEIEITIRARKGVNISKVMSGFPCTQVTPNREFKIVMPDIQSEESRDFLVKLDVPVGKKGEATTSLFDVSVRYTSAIDSQDYAQEQTLAVNRPAAVNKKKEEINLLVDCEMNRFLTAEAMEAVSQLGEGRQKEALALLATTTKTIQDSVSCKESKTVGLIADLNIASTKLKSVGSGASSYRNVDNMIHNMKHGYSKQRACAPQSAQMETYSSGARFAMKAKFSK